MRFGLYAINYGTCADPASLVRVAQYAEAGGLDSLWAGEHIVLPSPQPPDYAIAPEIPFLDAVVALALAAAHTTSITVGTGILELPLHQPVLLAKQLASVDQISRGRLVVGVGVGYLPWSSPRWASPSTSGPPAPTSTWRRCGRSGRWTRPSSTASTSTSPASTRTPAPSRPVVHRS